MKACCILLVLSTGVTAIGQSNEQSDQPAVVSNQASTVSLTNNIQTGTNWPAVTLAQPEAMADTNAPPETNPGPLTDEAFAARIIRDARVTPMISNEPKPNELTIGKFTYSGIIIEIAKMPNPLQLINPFAPPEYGPGEINLVRDPSGHPSGLKFFSIQF